MTSCCSLGPEPALPQALCGLLHLPSHKHVAISYLRCIFPKPLTSNKICPSFAVFIVLDGSHKDRRGLEKQVPKFKPYSQPCPALQPQGTCGGGAREAGVGRRRGWQICCMPTALSHLPPSVQTGSPPFPAGLQFIISDFYSRKIWVFGNPALENGIG